MHLLRVKHQSANLNRLPVRRLRRAARIRERAVRRQACPIRLRIVTFDERHLVRSLVGEMPPLVIRVVPDRVRAPRAVRVDEVHRDEVLLVQVAPVRHSERLVGDGVVNGPPDVDDADAGLEEAVGLVGEVVFDAFDGRLVRLIDVDLSLWCFEQASTVYRKTCRSGAAHYRAALLRVILVLRVTVTPEEASV